MVVCDSAISRKDARLSCLPPICQVLLRSLPKKKETKRCLEESRESCSGRCVVNQNFQLRCFITLGLTRRLEMELAPASYYS